MIAKCFFGLSKYLALAIVLVSLLTLLIPASLVRADTVVVFPDLNLEAAIRQAIEKPTGDIYESNLATLTDLDANGRGITDLDGLQYCVGLVHLNIYQNQISDITPLDGLTALTELGLDWNEISDITPLDGLTALTDLSLYQNQISDITPLDGLTALTELGLDWNEISNVSPLAGLTSLTKLYLSNNQISDITPLANLTGLTELDIHDNDVAGLSPLANLTSLTLLHLYGNQISDISPLANLTSLMQLRLGWNQISDISPLTGLTHVYYLALEENQISDLSPFSGVTNLPWLDLLYLNGNQISDIKPLSGLTGLSSLRIGSNQISDISSVSSLTSLTGFAAGYNQISDIEPVSSLTSLEWLELHSNQISDISPVSGLTSLIWLSLYDNPIGDISPLSGLTSLEHLTLGGSQISSVSPLSGLTELVELQLGGNQIGDISPLSGLTSLALLQLQGNQIIDISPLSGLTKLSELDLRWNQIIDIEPLVNNTGIASGDTLDLRNNPLDDLSVGAYIPELEAGGVTVWWGTSDNQPPDKPGNRLPENTSPGQSVTPTLRSTTFFDLDAGDTHKASQWQITTTLVDYSSPVFDSGTDTTHLTSIMPPALNYSTTYYWHVRYQDNHDWWSRWSDETSFTTTSAPPDTTPPTSPVVTDDGATTTSTSQLHATWSAAADAESGIAEYQYAIGTTTGGTDVVGWTSVGTNTEVTRTGLSLRVGNIYYFAVRAKNGSGLWSPVGASDGIAVSDTTPPTTPALTDDGTTTTSTSQLHATWSSNDAESGIAEYHYAIGTSAGVTDVLGWTSTGTNTEVTKTGLSLAAGTKYFISVKAKNGAGLWSEVGTSNGITVAAEGMAVGVIPPAGGTVQTADGKITAQFPANTAVGELTVAVENIAPPSDRSTLQGFKAGNTYFVIEITDASGNPVVTLSQPITITVKYSQEDVDAAGGDPNNLVLAYYDEAAGEWKTLDTMVNTSDKILSATTTHLSTWAVLAKAAESNGAPFWIWIIVGVGAVAVIGVGVSVLRRLVKKPVATG
jgi:internalin A